MELGHINIADFLEKTHGEVIGRIVTDSKNRFYKQTYSWKEVDEDTLEVQRVDGKGGRVQIKKRIPLDEMLVAFFGLYSGDGAKGSESDTQPGRIIPNISFSQKEPNLVRFAVDQFRRLFPGQIRFKFSIGEDSAYFMAGEGAEKLRYYYRRKGFDDTPASESLENFKLNDQDRTYLLEKRNVPGTTEEHLSFYYSHKKAMEEILTEVKGQELQGVGVQLMENDRVTASVRRPFKKGARQPGGTSRSDEIYIGGLNGLGELFLKILHEIEDSVLRDACVSACGLIKWNDVPSRCGQVVDLFDFFKSNNYGCIARERPLYLEQKGTHLLGQWPRSSETLLHRHIFIDPLWCYTSGLYLAEGTTDKAKLFRMFSENPGALALGFTSSEGASIELMLRALHKLFPGADCVDAWKVKVGSQYFPELVVTGLKHGVPMLRGGNSGDGKLRTMEISLSIKEWGLAVADEPLGQASLLRLHYENRFSHVEPTGSGVARIDFWCSSYLCRWYFPLLMYTVFGAIIPDPHGGFYR